MDLDTEWDKQANDIFVVLAVYTRVIGMDQIMCLKDGKMSYINIESNSLSLPG